MMIIQSTNLTLNGGLRALIGSMTTEDAFEAQALLEYCRNTPINI